MTMATDTRKARGLAEATRRAAASMAEVDLAARCRLLELPQPHSDGSLDLRMLGRDIRLTPPAFAAQAAGDGQEIHPVDRLLALRCLQCDRPIKPTGELITFRQFPGGRFYWRPFCSRTTEPLVRAIGNDLGRLRRGLSRFDWSDVSHGDLAARVQVLGPISVTLIYHAGDDEFGPVADILFDASLPRILCAEDAAAVAGRVCLRLCNEPCRPCSGCGLCDRPHAKNHTTID